MAGSDRRDRFGIMGGLTAAYLVWLVVRAPQSLQLGVINGWVGTAFRLAAGVVCLIGGLRRRPGSYVPLVFGLALIFTAIGNTILTVYSLHGLESWHFRGHFHYAAFGAQLSNWRS